MRKSVINKKIPRFGVVKYTRYDSLMDSSTYRNVRGANEVIRRYIGKKDYLETDRDVIENIPLGSGAYGTAYLTRMGTVMKFTTNPYEAASSLIIGAMGAATKSQARVFKVYMVSEPSMDFYIIEKELVQTPIYSYIMDEMGYGKGDAETLQDIVLEALELSFSSYDDFKKWMVDSFSANDLPIYSKAKSKKFFEENEEFMRSVYEFNKRLAKDKKESKDNLSFTDIHSGNVGMRENEVYCFDCVAHDGYALAGGGKLRGRDRLKAGARVPRKDDFDEAKKYYDEHVDGAGYSSDDYTPSAWRTMFMFLVSEGFSFEGAKEILLSKHTRWARDVARDLGKRESVLSTFPDWKRYYDMVGREEFANMLKGELGIMEKGGDVTKMPIIARVITKPIEYSVGDKKHTMPPSAYNIVAIQEITAHDGSLHKEYITNKWYKEHNQVPLVIIDSIVDKVEMLKQQGGVYRQGGELKEWEFIADMPKKYVDIWHAEDFCKQKLNLPQETEIDFVSAKEGYYGFRIQYEIEHELRNWGVKDVGINVVRVWGTMKAEWTEGEYPDEKYLEDDVEFDTADFEIIQYDRGKGDENKWVVKTELPKGCSPDNPTGLSINFETMEIEVSFVNLDYEDGGEIDGMYRIGDYFIVRESEGGEDYVYPRSRFDEERSWYNVTNREGVVLYRAESLEEAAEWIGERYSAGGKVDDPATKDRLKDIISNNPGIKADEISQQMGVDITNVKNISIYFTLKNMVASGEVVRVREGRKYAYSIGKGVPVQFKPRQPKKLDEAKRKELIERIGRDLGGFRPGGGDRDEVTVDEDSAHVGIRDLGDWEHDYESHYDEDDESWIEDDDNMIWAPGEYKRYEDMFDRWAKQHDWYGLVDIDVDTGEKNWAYFHVSIKDGKERGGQVGSCEAPLPEAEGLKEASEAVELLDKAEMIRTWILTRSVKGAPVEDVSKAAKAIGVSVADIMHVKKNI